MKRNCLYQIVIVVVCLTLLLPFNILANDTDSQSLEVSNNLVSYTDEFEIAIETADVVYYPFIYDSNNEWFVDNLIGPTNCQNGYLYVKNLETGNIIKLISEPINVYAQFNNGVYFIFGNSVYYVDFDGNIQKTFSSSSVLNGSILELQNGNLYFCEGSKIIKYNINNQTKTTIARANNVSMLFIKSDNEIVYKANDNVYYINNNSVERSTRIITDEYEYNRLFGESEEETNISVATETGQIDANLTSINSQYPAGSYFSNSGSKCTHHSSGCSYRLLFTVY